MCSSKCLHCLWFSSLILHYHLILCRRRLHCCNCDYKNLNAATKSEGATFTLIILDKPAIKASCTSSMYKLTYCKQQWTQQKTTVCVTSLNYTTELLYNNTTQTTTQSAYLIGNLATTRIAALAINNQHICSGLLCAASLLQIGPTSIRGVAWAPRLDQNTFVPAAAYAIKSLQCGMLMLTSYVCLFRCQSLNLRKRVLVCVAGVQDTAKN